MSSLFGDELQSCVMSVLREQGHCTIAGLKAATFMQEVPITIAVRNLQNQAVIEHGYIDPLGNWMDDWFPSEDPNHFAIDAWRICK